MKEKVLIIDAFGLIFRAYYAFIKRPLTTKSGFPTSAVFGFWKMIFKSLKDLNPDRWVIALDSPGPTFRKEMYSEYKANRQETPEDLKEQIAYIVDMIKEAQIPHLMQGGMEADDIIAFLVKKYGHDENEVYILSSDKDLAQLVNQNTFMATPDKFGQGVTVMDSEGVVEKFGIRPDQIVDYLSLIGDTSDNIPGVRGIGPKTAVKLLSQYETLENLYTHLDEITAKGTRTKLETGKELAFMSKELVVLKEDIEGLDLAPLEKSELAGTPFAALNPYFNELEFRMGQDDFFKNYYDSGAKKAEAAMVAPESYDDEMSLFPSDTPGPTTEPAERGNYQLILKKTELLDLKEKLMTAEITAIDTETTSVDIQQAQLIGFSCAVKAGEGFYVPLFDKNPADFDKAEFFSILKPFLESAQHKKIGQNIKYDAQILAPYCDLQGIAFDTMLAAYLLEPDSKQYGMDYLAEKYLNYHTVHYSSLVGKDQTLLDVELEKVADYAAEDADVTFRLYEELAPLLEEKNLAEIYETQEMPLVPILADMESEGIGLDLQRLKDIQVELEDKIAELEYSIYNEAGFEFNLNSPKQIGEVLFEKMGLPVVKKTKTGYSTNEQVLEQLSDYSIATNILAYRKLFKLLSTYVSSLPKYLRNGRIHTCFHQTGTATGRLSSSDPNLQNIPVRDEAGRAIRSAFIAKPGYKLFSIDYSQIELRLMAHLSEDANMIAAFNQEKDIHRWTASLVFDVSEADVDNFQRHLAKSINFGIIYGMGAYKFSREVGVTMREGKEFIDRYFAVFSGVKGYIEAVKQEAYRDGYVKTLFGHKRNLMHIRSTNKNLKAADERMAVNTLIQGSNADLLKKAMIAIFPELGKFQSKMLLQIHDELIFEVPEAQCKAFETFIVDTMENILKLKVPLKVSVSSGRNWGELK